MGKVILRIGGTFARELNNNYIFSSGIPSSLPFIHLELLESYYAVTMHCHTIKKPTGYQFFCQTAGTLHSAFTTSLSSSCWCTFQVLKISLVLSENIMIFVLILTEFPKLYFHMFSQRRKVLGKKDN